MMSSREDAQLRSVTELRSVTDSFRLVTERQKFEETRIGRISHDCRKLQNNWKFW